MGAWLKDLLSFEGWADIRQGSLLQKVDSDFKQFRMRHSFG